MYSQFTLFYIAIIYSEKGHASLEQNFTAEAKTLLHAPTFSTRNIQKFRYLHLRDGTLHQSKPFSNMLYTMLQLMKICN
jgi:hypothetical protein